ncbi:MAG: heme ABC exporter ATP-binding protein CcmA [Armatimonadota bacterium]|nr:heme ABC exporter ATP-binding protein CcmA [bacterium]
MVSLSISNLTHEFDGREVLRSLNFTFGGSCMIITGPNGSGKSTLLRVIGGLLTPTEGDVTISIDGTPIPRDSVKEMAGIAAPDIRLYAELSARENLAFLVRARGIKTGRIMETLEEVGLANRADDPVRELSSGLRQRACLAATLVHEPKLLLLDEPSTNLDADGVEMLWRMIERRSKLGMVVLATNDPAEAALGETVLNLGAKR